MNLCDNEKFSLFFLFHFFSLSSRFEREKIMSSEKSIFQRPFWVVVFALSAAISWGWAYPLIKLGFDEFGITQSMTGSKMLFAGVRFLISGFLILLIARFFKAGHDTGMVIGHHGKIAKAIRSVMKAASVNSGKKVNVDIR